MQPVISVLTVALHKKRSEILVDTVKFSERGFQLILQKENIIQIRLTPPGSKIRVRAHRAVRDDKLAADARKLRENTRRDEKSRCDLLELEMEVFLSGSLTRPL